MSEIERLQHAIRFMEASSTAKQNIDSSESDRLRLEIELNRLNNSEDNITKSKVKKFRDLYNKLCAEEASSMERNQRLLAEIRHFDSQFDNMERKLELLKQVKERMVEHFKRAYPKWTSENRIFEPHPSSLNDQSRLGQSLPQGQNSQDQNRTLGVLMDALRPNQDPVPSAALIAELDATREESRAPLRVATTSSSMSPTSMGKNNNTVLQNMIFAPPQPISTVSPTKTHGQVKSQQLQQKQQNSPISTARETRPNSSTSMTSRKTHASNLVMIAAAEYKENMEAAAAASARAAALAEEQNMMLQSGTQQVENNLLKEYEQDIKRRDSTLNDFNASSTIHINQLGLMTRLSNEYLLNRDDVPPIRQQPNQQQTQINMWSDANRNESGYLLQQHPEAQFDSKNGSALRQDLNMTGLFNLLDLIEEEISHTIHPENFYRQVAPHFKNEMEIIRLARENKTLNQDPGEVSMVVLNQLPAVIDKFTKNKCLFTRDVLGLSVADINEQLVAKSLRGADESDKRLWRRLVKHWTTICKANKMSSLELARLFGPKLLGYSSSSASEKAIKFVEKIINDAVNLESSGGGAAGPSSAPQTARSLTETSINQELMMASSSKLKESSFYQEFIHSSHSGSGKLKQLAIANKSLNSNDDDDDEDDDENDDIDALVAPKSAMSTGNQTIKSKPSGGQFIKSPRGPHEQDFDFSQHSISDSQKVPPKVLHSLRSTGDKEKLPVYLRNLDSEDESDLSYGISARTKSKGDKSEADYDFYN